MLALTRIASGRVSATSLLATRYGRHSRPYFTVLRKGWVLEPTPVLGLKLSRGTRKKNGPPVGVLIWGECR